MNYSNYSARLLFSQELRLALKDARAFADEYGLERLDHLTGFPRVTENIENTPVNHSDSEILTEVETIGLQLNSTLVSLIMKCSIQDVRHAITVVEQTSKRETVKNPEGLFYRVLQNKRKSNNFGF